MKNFIKNKKKKKKNIFYKKSCADRESNPDQILGKDLLYHSTIGACLLFVESIKTSWRLWINVVLGCFLRIGKNMILEFIFIFYFIFRDPTSILPNHKVSLCFCHIHYSLKTYMLWHRDTFGDDRFHPFRVHCLAIPSVILDLGWVGWTKKISKHNLWDLTHVLSLLNVIGSGYRQHQ